MNYRLLPLLLLLPAAAPAPLDAVVAALAATRTMTAAFVQTAGDGKVSQGMLTIARPGKIRFDYKGLPLLIIADGKRLSMIDYEVSQVSQWPIGATPLAALLDPAKDVPRYARVVGSLPGGGLLVEARDQKHPEYGSLTLAFARRGDAPGGLALTGWTARDAQNGRTEVRLTGARYNQPVADSQFRFRDPRPRRVPGKTF